MFDLNTIHDIDKKALENGWTYPMMFEALKSAGIERYETNVLKHEIKYVGGGGSVTMPAPEGFTPLTAAARFDALAVALAIERIQKRETTYPEFLGELAAAGCAFYRVDMRPRTITYHGPTPQDKLVEKVPLIKKKE
jgi:uncharacterized protein YbcV (DUF1398 family)